MHRQPQHAQLARQAPSKYPEPSSPPAPSPMVHRTAQVKAHNYAEGPTYIQLTTNSTFVPHVPLLYNRAVLVQRGFALRAPPAIPNTSTATQQRRLLKGTMPHLPPHPCNTPAAKSRESTATYCLAVARHLVRPLAAAGRRRCLVRTPAGPATSTVTKPATLHPAPHHLPPAAHDTSCSTAAPSPACSTHGHD